MTRRYIAYYWPKPGGHINSFSPGWPDHLPETVPEALEVAREWEARARIEAAKIWTRDDAYDNAARGYYPKVIAIVSYPGGS
jgi:hypothetical protein